MKKLTLITTLAAGSLALAACGGSSDDGSSTDEIMIGSVHPLTGALAGVGALMNDGAKLAVDDINADGGIEALDGAQLTLGEGDSKGAADTGQSEAQRLIGDGAVALVGTYQSDVTTNVAAVAERSKVPLVIDVAVDDSILEQGYQYSFRIQPNATSMGTDGANDLIEMSEAAGKPVESVSYIHIEGAFGQSVFDAFKAEAEAQGVQVLKEVTYAGTNFTDATTQVREAASVNPDVIVATGYYPDSLLVAQAVNALQPDIDALYGVANGGFDDSAFPGDAGAAGQNVLSANYHYGATNDEVADIRQRFQEEFGKPMETASVLAYQSVRVIAQALEESGSTDPEELRNAIADIEVDDPLLAFDGPITFDETGQNENATVIVMQIQGDAVEQVFPEDFATSDVVYPTNQ
ncbi:branched-chain amino acid transport system substrate-binding protein [Mumia flava]|uniref:Branched-chain amino acid transport system substrate-binding protein n=1 Tax=Mumia flava TaxID=1348852 RepID=A0A0B2BAU1_9ACTN|nr:ABC transporter substrate-binding protein [Mumia flava]PJJ56178.1 branched-chain amino acid transport system substrate-binding protein [Mumia flava]